MRTRKRSHRELDSELPDEKQKETSEIVSCSQRFIPPSQKPEIIYTDNSKAIVEACQDLQWNHDASTPRRSETNGVAEKSRPPSERGNSYRIVRWNAGVVRAKCRTRLPMAKTAFETGDMARHLNGPSIPFGTLVEYIQITSKDK